jgi:hypothetical protein
MKVWLGMVDLVSGKGARCPGESGVFDRSEERWGRWRWENVSILLMRRGSGMGGNLG